MSTKGCFAEYLEPMLIREVVQFAFLTERLKYVRFILNQSGIRHSENKMLLNLSESEVKAAVQ